MGRRPFVPDPIHLPIQSVSGRRAVIKVSVTNLADRHQNLLDLLNKTGQSIFLSGEKWSQCGSRLSLTRLSGIEVFASYHTDLCQDRSRSLITCAALFNRHMYRL